MDPFEMFSEMFGGGGGGGGGRRGGQTQSVLYQMELSLEEINRGVKKEFNYNRTSVCKGCKGRGATRVQRCPGCGGRGVEVTERRMGSQVFRMQRPCSQCSGQGEYADPEDLCKECGAQGVVRSKASLTVDVPAGCADGKQWAFPGKADERPGMQTGDVIVLVVAAKHARFIRMGEHLVMEKTIPLIDALTG